MNTPHQPHLITGEPYELAGNRLAFTNWFYVRPCTFGWYDDHGRNVSVRGDLGPAAQRLARRGLMRPPGDPGIGWMRRLIPRHRINPTPDGSNPLKRVHAGRVEPASSRFGIDQPPVSTGGGLDRRPGNPAGGRIRKLPEDDRQVEGKLSGLNGWATRMERYTRMER